MHHGLNPEQVTSSASRNAQAEWLPLAREVIAVFAQFGFSPELIRAIRGMGYDTPTPVQRDVIPLALAGGDLLATAETGSGKTAAFLLPLIQRLRDGRKGRVRALIVSPTREIAAQTTAQAVALSQGSGLRSVSVYGGVALGSQRQALRGGCDIVVATPGRLLDHHRRGDVRLDSVETVVIDEADRMMDMGFIPDLRRILALLPRDRQSMLFAATMPVELIELAYAQILRDPTHVEIGSPCAPPTTVSQSVYMVPSDRKTDLLVGLLEQEAMRSVVVFVRTRRRADSLARRLRGEAMRVECIHGHRSQREREKALESFKQRSARVLVATDVAARGLHVEGVTHVVNYDVPAMPAEYLNRIGRTARAGASGDALTLAAREESSALAGIERTLGAHLPRVTVDGVTEPEREPRPPATARAGIRARGSRGPSMRGRRRWNHHYRVGARSSHHESVAPVHRVLARGWKTDTFVLRTGAECSVRRVLRCRSWLPKGAKPYVAEPGREHKEATMAGKSLYVGNLSYSTSESKLRELFAEFEPSEVRMIQDKGFAFVDVPVEKANDAIAAMNGKEVDGRSLTVNEARPRGERSGGGDRRGGGGFGGGGRRW